MRRHALTAIGLLLIASLPVHGQTVIRKESPQGYIEVYENAAINWSEGVLTATGVGLMPRDEPNRARAYLKARGYARLDALANLLMLIDRVQIDAQYHRRRLHDAKRGHSRQRHGLCARRTGHRRAQNHRRGAGSGTGNSRHGDVWEGRAEPPAATPIACACGACVLPRLSRRCRASSYSGRTCPRA
jgi:hypothetical protein